MKRLIVAVVALSLAAPAWAQEQSSLTKNGQLSVMPNAGGPPIGWCTPKPPEPQVVEKVVERVVERVVQAPPPMARVIERERVVEKMAARPSWQIFFDFDKSQPQAKCQEKLRAIADYMAKSPERTLILSGHADVRTLVGHAYNTRLSDRRAAAVKADLVGKGVAASRIRGVALGDVIPADLAQASPSLAPACPPKQPGKTTKSEEERCQQDRRVEVLVH